jgi:CheY-like chemotaxis protein
MSPPKLERILLVEDDPDIQFIARMALQRISGYQVEVCNNGIEALQKLPLFQPQMVVMDMMMPEMDGLTTFQEMRKIPAFAHLPVVIMTAKAQAHEIENYKREGINDVIIKPFEPAELGKQLEQIWQSAAL